jgi:hypothetical protein
MHFYEEVIEENQMMHRVNSNSESSRIKLRAVLIWKHIVI